LAENRAVAQTWHYGLVATWWDEFNREGPEIEFFRRYVEPGQPALDVCCGTGRLLLPYLHAGLDVDGCDISPDMLERCRARAEREGLPPPTLLVQATHELDPPRRYRTAYMCGGFGLGGDRADDVEGLRRIYDCLEPGGTFVVDNEVPYARGNPWPQWQEGRDEYPRPRREGVPGADERRTGSDGAEYALRSRILELEPLEQRVVYEMRAYKWCAGELVAEEEHRLCMTLYFTHELKLLLERAGFRDIELLAGYDDRPPTGDDAFVVFVARKA
jgi:SAM-dependent methyltransferase